LGFEVGEEHLDLKIQGMHCASCVTGIEEALRDTAGVIGAQVSLGTESASIDYLPAAASLDSIRAAIESRGYGVDSDLGAEAPDREAEEREREYRDLMRNS
jgi:Cu+-exporting ATPase